MTESCSQACISGKRSILGSCSSENEESRTSWACSEAASTSRQCVCEGTFLRATIRILPRYMPFAFAQMPRSMPQSSTFPSKHAKIGSAFFRARPCHCRHANQFLWKQNPGAFGGCAIDVTRDFADSTTHPWLLTVCFIPVLYPLGFGVIHSQSVEDGFRAVDRRFFVPPVRPRKGPWLLTNHLFSTH
jgi:hypothetical protein